MDSITVTPPSVLYVGIEVKQCIHFFNDDVSVTDIHDLKYLVLFALRPDL